MSAAVLPPAANPAPANPARGEAALSVFGHVLTLRPSFAALVAVEQELGSLFAFVERAAGGQLGLAETIVLIFNCIVDKPDDLTREKLGEALVQTGIAALTPVLRVLIAQIVKGL